MSLIVGVRVTYIHTCITNEIGNFLICAFRVTHLLYTIIITFFKKDNGRILKGWVFDNMQSTMNTFSEALYFLHVEVMANLDHNNSIELDTEFPSNN